MNIKTGTMSQISADQFAQRLYDCRLMDNKQINAAFSELGTRDVTVEELQRKLIHNELLTNWQIQRVMDGHRSGYFYGNWKVLYIVGTGTFARVYRAVHVNTGDVRAVKVLRSRYSDDLVTRERFMREARTVMKLRHPNIVPIYEVDSHRGRIYMVMNFIEGQNLREFLKAQGRVKVMTALEITRDVCAGLDYATQHGITHRDVKLSNVLLSSSGRASLVDFGLATADDEMRGGFFNPRSVDYAGLEKATNVPRHDKRSDIFFVGCNLYQMVSGKPPLFETRERMRRMNPQRYREIQPVSTLMPDLPHRVVNLINRTMMLDPAARIQTPREALDETCTTINAVKEGDDRRYDAQLSKQEAEEYAKLTRKTYEGRDYTVMVVESNTSVQDVLRRRLKKLGYRTLILGDPLRALDRFRNLDPAEDLPADCVVFGSAGLGSAAVQAFNELINIPTKGEVPAILLVRDEQMIELGAQAEVKPYHRIISLPIKFPRIRRALRELLHIEVEEPVSDDDED